MGSPALKEAEGLKPGGEQNCIVVSLDRSPFSLATIQFFFPTNQLYHLLQSIALRILTR